MSQFIIIEWMGFYDSTYDSDVIQYFDERGIDTYVLDNVLRRKRIIKFIEGGEEDA